MSMKRFFVSNIRRLLLANGIVVKRHRPKEFYTIYASIFTQLCEYKKEVSLVQIGANDGFSGDPVFPIVKKYPDNTKLLLIEPQSDLIDKIKKNYSFHKRVEIENCAISDKIKTLRLYRISELNKKYFTNDQGQISNTSGWTSSDKENIINFIKIANKLPKSITPEAALEEIICPCFPLETVLRQRDFPAQFDILNVDTEGTDDTVLFSCALEKTKPRMISFESGFLSEERKQKLFHYLRALGYAIFEDKANHSLALKLS